MTARGGLVIAWLLAAGLAHAGPKPKPSAKVPSLAILVVNSSRAGLNSIYIRPTGGRNWGENLIAFQNFSPGSELAVPIDPGSYDIWIKGANTKTLMKELKVSIKAALELEVIKGGKVVTSRPEPKHLAKVIAEQAKDAAADEREQRVNDGERATARRDKRHWEIDLGGCPHGQALCGTIVYANHLVSSCIGEQFEDDVTKQTPLPAEVTYETIGDPVRKRAHFIVKRANIKYVMDDDCRLTTEPLE